MGLAAALPPKIELGAVGVALENIDVASVVLTSVALVVVAVAAFPNTDDAVVAAPPKTEDPPPNIELAEGVAAAPPKTLTIGALCGILPKFSAPA